MTAFCEEFRENFNIWYFESPHIFPWWGSCNPTRLKLSLHQAEVYYCMWYKWEVLDVEIPNTKLISLVIYNINYWKQNLVTIQWLYRIRFTNISVELHKCETMLYPVKNEPIKPYGIIQTNSLSNLHYFNDIHSSWIPMKKWQLLLTIVCVHYASLHAHCTFKSHIF